jgi:hypothetical protein
VRRHSLTHPFTVFNFSFHASIIKKIYSGNSPGTESASSVQRFIRGMPRAFAFVNTDSHRSESGSPTSDADGQYNISDHNIGINAESSLPVATFGQSRLAAGTPVSESGALKSKLRFCSCRRSQCLKVSCHFIFKY